jgi:site-specific DNA recombinase
MHSTAALTVHEFTMTGLFSCEPCGRRLEPHWSHGRAAHRCRHGRISSRHRWTTPIKNIYAREDQATGFLANASITLADLPAILEGHQAIIWCDHDMWRLEIDGNAVIEQAPPRMTPIPKQRTPGQAAKTPPENQAASMEAVGK